MIRVNLRTLKSRRQLAPVDYKKVISAGFADENCEQFCITFDVGNGNLRDLSIFFETRTPHIFISDVYREEQVVKKISKATGNKKSKAVPSNNEQ